MGTKVPKSDERLKCRRLTGLAKANKNQTPSSSVRHSISLSLESTRQEHKQRKRRRKYDVDVVSCIWNKNSYLCPLCALTELQDPRKDSLVYFDGQKYHLLLHSSEQLRLRIVSECSTLCFCSYLPFVWIKSSKMKDTKWFLTLAMKKTLNKLLKSSAKIHIKLTDSKDTMQSKSQCIRNVFCNRCEHRKLSKNVVSLQNLKKVRPAKRIKHTVFTYPINNGYPIQATSEPSAEESGIPSGLVSSASSLQEPGTSGHDEVYAAETRSQSRRFNSYPPRYAEYKDIVKRRQTFTHWQRQLPEPSQLADAGFFFTSK